MKPTVKPLFPNGVCHCGCNEALSNKRRAMFKSGHDSTALSKLIHEEYGGVAEMLVAHGRGQK